MRKPIATDVACCALHPAMLSDPNMIDAQTYDDVALREAEKQQVLPKTMELLLSVGYFPSAMHLLVVSIIAVVLSGSSALSKVLIWSIFFVFALAAQANMIRSFGGRRLEIGEAQAAHRQFGVTQIAIGSLWGFCGFFLFPSENFGAALLVVFVMGGMAMSAVATQHASLRFCVFQIILGITPLAIAYTLSDLPFSELSGFFLALYLCVLGNLALRQHRFARQAIDLQIVQERLLRDLSEQAQQLEVAREYAEEANAAKSRFLAQASHDLRQPLHAISLFVETLPSITDKERSNEVLGKVRQSLDILTKLFDSLLDVTMLDTGGIEVREVPFRMQKIIDQVIADFELVASANDVKLVSVPNSQWVKSDPVLVTRMLQNLVSNAIRYAPGERAVVGCRLRQGEVSLIVADNGCGIAQADQKRIFGEFQRLEGARMGDTATPGLGLGLSIVHRIANEMGLRISASSTGAKGATVFELSGLTKTEPLTDERKKGSKTQEDLLANLRVFVLDDNKETLEANELLLQRWGCEVSTGSAFEDFPTVRPDIMICDYEISTTQTGIDVLDQMQKEFEATIPAIIVSGHNSSALKEQVATHRLLLLHKPLRPAPLRSAMLNIIASARSNREQPPTTPLRNETALAKS